MRRNPDVLYAAMWQAWRQPWGMSSGGAHSALYKTTDGGATWTNLTKTARGMPKGMVGKIGVAVSPAKPSRVWALIEHDSGGIYRSDDAGASVGVHQSRPAAAAARLVLLAHLRRPQGHRTSCTG